MMRMSSATRVDAPGALGAGFGYQGSSEAAARVFKGGLKVFLGMFAAHLSRLTED